MLGYNVDILSAQGIFIWQKIQHEIVLCIRKTDPQLDYFLSLWTEMEFPLVDSLIHENRCWWGILCLHDVKTHLCNERSNTSVWLKINVGSPEASGWKPAFCLTPISSRLTKRKDLPVVNELIHGLMDKMLFGCVCVTRGVVSFLCSLGFHH